jgi:hypothetical protein
MKKPSDYYSKRVMLGLHFHIWLVMERNSDTMLASCLTEENADLIVAALAQMDERGREYPGVSGWFDPLHTTTI